MTTSFLSHKLMVVKLDKSEFEKVKWLKKTNKEEKHKAADVLQHILKQQAAAKVCRLCLRPGENKIFEDNIQDSIAVDIKNVLGIKIQECDGLPQHICRSCFKALRSAAILKTTAETTQWRLRLELDIVMEASSEIDEVQPKKLVHGGFFNTRGSEIVREWACKKCSKTFQDAAEFVEHEGIPSCRRRRKSCICEICGRELKSITLLKRHRTIHTGEPGAFKCKYCPYGAHTRHALTVHERWHTGDRPVQCPHCPKTFPNAANLWTHKKRHLPPNYHCEICPKSFRYKEILADHLASVHGTEKPFHCDACGKTFATRKKLLRHERVVHNRPLMRRLERVTVSREASNV